MSKVNRQNEITTQALEEVANAIADFNCVAQERMAVIKKNIDYLSDPENFGGDQGAVTVEVTKDISKIIDEVSTKLNSFRACAMKVDAIVTADQNRAKRAGTKNADQVKTAEVKAKNVGRQ